MFNGRQHAFTKLLLTTCSTPIGIYAQKRPMSRAQPVTTYGVFLSSYYCLPVGNATALGRGPLRDVQVPQFASLELIHETVYHQVLPAIRPRSLHWLRIDNILDLRAHARFNDLRQCFGLREVLEVQRAGKRGKRRQPARKGRRRGQ